MKPNVLTVASLLSIVLLPLHVAGDIVLGFDRGGPGMLTLVGILLLFACGAFLLADRKSGNVIMFLAGLGTMAMPIIHRNNGFTPEVARSPGGVLFVWTLLALGVTGGLVVVLAARGFWALRRRRN